MGRRPSPYLLLGVACVGSLIIRPVAWVSLRR